jgi:co-chaperonin GroES (HSP10)
VNPIEITPGPGRIAVEKIDLSQELEVRQITGKKIRLKVISSDNHEGLVASVIAVCKPWSTVDAPDKVFYPEYSEGEVVVIGKWTGTRLSIDGREFTVLREEDVLCKLSRRPELVAPTIGDESLEPDLSNPVDAAAATL